MRTKTDKQFLDTMSKDPGNWRGPFYFNRKDPRLLVPKLHPSLGWTLNFASPGSYVAIGALIAIIIIIGLISK
jgi:uncharacterized membrane protein